MKAIGYRSSVCGCEWSAGHGPRCPEHGEIGGPIRDPVEERDALRDRVAELEAELAVLRPDVSVVAFDSPGGPVPVTVTKSV